MSESKLFRKTEPLAWVEDCYDGFYLRPKGAYSNHETTIMGADVPDGFVQNETSAQAVKRMGLELARQGNIDNAKRIDRMCECLGIGK